MSKLRRLPLLVLVLGLIASGCAASDDGADADEPSGPEPVTADDEEEPASEEPASDEPASEEPATEPEGSDDASEDDASSSEGDEGDDARGPEVTVYFVRSHDSGIWVEPETHALDAPTKAVARGAMALLFGGSPHDPGLTSQVPADVQVLATNIRDRVLIVDVSDAVLEGGGGSAQEIAFAEQFAHTGAAFGTVDAVQLWVEGRPIDELWGHLDWSQPIEPDPFAVSPVTITEPSLGSEGAAANTGEVVIRGEARVFEATVGIRLYGPGGDLVDEDFVTATEGAPARGTWEHRVTISDPGSYTLEVSEDDPSDGEGRPPFVATRVIDVR